MRSVGVLAVIGILSVQGQQIPLQFEPCQAGEVASPENQLAFTQFYGQLERGSGTAFRNASAELRVVALGSTQSTSTGFSNEVSSRPNRSRVSNADYWFRQVSSVCNGLLSLAKRPRADNSCSYNYPILNFSQL